MHQKHVYILERQQGTENGESQTIEIITCFDDFDLLHQWVRQNNQEYEKNEENPWVFFASKELLNGIIDENEQVFYLIDWNGMIIKDN